MTKIPLKAKIIMLSFTITLIILSLSGCGLEAKKSNSNPSPTVIPIGSPSSPTPTPIPIGATVPDLSPITYRLDNLDKQITSLQTQITELGARVNSLSSSSSSNTSATTAAATAAAITDLQAKVAQLQSQLTMYYNSTSNLFRVSTGVLYGPHYVGNQNTALTFRHPASWRGQTFTATATGVFTGVNGLFAKTGDPQTVMFHLVSVDAAGAPSSMFLSTGSLNTSLVGSSYSQWYNVPMTPYNVVVGTKYAVILESPRGDSQNFIGWGADAINPTYTDGAAYTSEDSGKTWKAVTPDTDLTFVVNVD